MGRLDCSVSLLCVARLLSSQSKRINTHLVPSFVVSSTAVLSAMLGFELTRDWLLFDVTGIVVASLVAERSDAFSMSSLLLSSSSKTDNSESKAFSWFSASLPPESY